MEDNYILISVMQKRSANRGRVSQGRGGYDMISMGSSAIHFWFQHCFNLWSFEEMIQLKIKYFDIAKLFYGRPTKIM
jgi:hypothetical protein